MFRVREFKISECDLESLQNSDEEFEIEQMHGMDKYFEWMQFKMSRQFDMEYRKQQTKKHDKAIEHYLHCIHSVRYLNYHKCYQKSYILYIYLTGIKPRIWRQVQIPSNISLAVFHDKILTPLFNWTRNYHSYHFLVPHRKNRFIGFGPTKSSAVDVMHTNYIKGSQKCGSFVIESSQIYLSDVLYLKNSTLRYVYDLGDLFHHTIVLKDIVFKQTINDKITIKILGGERNGPPEDNKGNTGYVERLNDVINNNNYEQYDEFCNAINIRKYFNPETFDSKRIKKRMKKYFKSMLSRQDFGRMKSFGFGGSKSISNYGRVYRDCFYRNCSKRNPETMKACQACKSAFYCSRSCQKRHWNVEHRYFCFNHRKVKIKVI